MMCTAKMVFMLWITLGTPMWNTIWNLMLQRWQPVISKIMALIIHLLSNIRKAATTAHSTTEAKVIRRMASRIVLQRFSQLSKQAMSPKSAILAMDGTCQETQTFHHNIMTDFSLTAYTTADTQKSVMPTDIQRKNIQVGLRVMMETISDL